MDCRPPMANFFPVDVHSSAQGEGLPEVKPLSTAAPANEEQEQDPGQAPADATFEPEPQQAVAAAAPMGAEASPRHTPRSPQTAKPADTFPAAPPSTDSAWLGMHATSPCSVHSVLLQPSCHRHVLVCLGAERSASFCPAILSGVRKHRVGGDDFRALQCPQDLEK